MARILWKCGIGCRIVSRGLVFRLGSIIHTFQPLFNDGFPTYYALLYPKISISPSFMDFFAKKKNHISMVLKKLSTLFTNLYTALLIFSQLFSNGLYFFY